jgi:hypothetical protein
MFELQRRINLKKEEKKTMKTMKSAKNVSTRKCVSLTFETSIKLISDSNVLKLFKCVRKKFLNNSEQLKENRSFEKPDSQFSFRCSSSTYYSFLLVREDYQTRLTLIWLWWVETKQMTQSNVNRNARSTTSVDHHAQISWVVACCSCNTSPQ